jgi:hypothetical protein
MRHWWEDDRDGRVLVLLNPAGKVAAWIVQEYGEYVLRNPFTWPCLKWPDVETAKRGAESSSRILTARRSNGTIS